MNERVVLANGCFDVLHVGHVWHLEEARQVAQNLDARLVVALTVDHAVNKGPGLPINTWEHRAAVLRALRCVDEVLPSVTCFDVIRQTRPLVFVKGSDYIGSSLLDEARAACKEVGASVYLTGTEKISSRVIAEKMRTLPEEIIKVTVRFDGDVDQLAQGMSLLAFERHLRALTKQDCRVFKEKMGDDSKLRVKMTPEERARL